MSRFGPSILDCGCILDFDRAVYSNYRLPIQRVVELPGMATLFKTFLSSNRARLIARWTFYNDLLLVLRDVRQ